MTVSRSKFRNNQRYWLKRACGKRTVFIGESHVVMAHQDFREMLGWIETLEIMGNPELMTRLVAVGETLERELLAGNLRSIEEAFL